MTTRRSVLVLLTAVAATGLAGCSQVKRLTGQNDNTVLPGEREPILPPDQTTGRSPDIKRSGSSNSTAPNDLGPACDPETDINCGVSGGGAGADTGDGFYSDGQ